MSLIMIFQQLVKMVKIKHGFYVGFKKFESCKFIFAIKKCSSILTKLTILISKKIHDFTEKILKIKPDPWGVDNYQLTFRISRIIGHIVVLRFINLKSNELITIRPKIGQKYG